MADTAKSALQCGSKVRALPAHHDGRRAPEAGDGTEAESTARSSGPAPVKGGEIVLFGNVQYLFPRLVQPWQNLFTSHLSANSSNTGLQVTSPLQISNPTTRSWWHQLQIELPENCLFNPIYMISLSLLAICSLPSFQASTIPQPDSPSLRFRLAFGGSTGIMESKRGTFSCSMQLLRHDVPCAGSRH